MRFSIAKLMTTAFMASSVTHTKAFSPSSVNHADWFSEPTFQPKVDKSKIRQSNKVGEYSGQDRTWTFPKDAQTRHTNDNAPYLNSNDRTWHLNKDSKTIRTDVKPPKNGASDYTSTDRTWTFPNDKLTRHDNEHQAPYFSSNDRMWREDNSRNHLLHP